MTVVFFLFWEHAQRAFGFDLSYYAADYNDRAILKPHLDIADYDRRMLALAHIYDVGSTTATTTRGWPVQTTYPRYGALLPFNRIMAFYGNFMSKQMGILGEYPADEMIAKLNAQKAEWEKADPTTPVIPAIEYIAVVAQGAAGRDGMYRGRMGDGSIDHALDLARRVNGIVVLDIQSGLSPAMTEVHALENYLKLPNVHLALDAEFAMKNGSRPGTVVGTLDASEINASLGLLLFDKDIEGALVPHMGGKPCRLRTMPGK